MPIVECCSLNPVTARPEEPIREVAQRLETEDIGCAVVVDAEDRPLGMVTDRDIALRVLRRRLDPDQTPIEQVMHGELAWVREDAGLDQALRRMRGDGVRRIPVVNDDGVLTGILTWDDALQVIAREVSAAAAVAATQMRSQGGASAEKGSGHA